ncbi:hypothetical protein WN48_06685 [Eufriesea mexicana]|uniref:Uncharacterized protein n=1 Tax=Eufriesea mexicana TaxID=516756 RepID=A0A310SJW7_9HYME|nr:hypothetical protein WN48_06685 [Eufriesea mexicana]
MSHAHCNNVCIYKKKRTNTTYEKKKKKEGEYRELKGVRVGKRNKRANIVLLCACVTSVRKLTTNQIHIPSKRSILQHNKST